MNTTDLSNIWKFDLIMGSSKDPKYGCCFMDAVSWYDTGMLGDHPVCVSPVLAGFGRSINDLMDGTSRQRLKSYIPKMVNSVDPEAEIRRALYLSRAALFVFAGDMLDSIDMYEESTALKSYHGVDVSSYDDMTPVRNLISGIRSKIEARIEDLEEIANSPLKSMVSALSQVLSSRPKTVLIRHYRDAIQSLDFAEKALVYADTVWSLQDMSEMHQKCGRCAAFAGKKTSPDMFLTILDTALAMGRHGEDFDTDKMASSNKSFLVASEK
jgi:hypothetical protein